jgi:hypothetical protein
MTVVVTPAGFSTGRIFARALALGRRRPVTFLLLSAALAGLPAVATGWATMRFQAATTADLIPGNIALADYLTWLAILEGVGIAVACIGFLLQGAVAICAAHDLAGQSGGIGEALIGGLRRAPILVIVGLVTTIATLFGTILLIVPGVILAMAWSVAPPVAALEAKGVFSALGRSAELTRGHRWILFGIILLISVATFVSNLVLRLVVGQPVFGAAANGSPIVNLVVAPLSATFWAAVMAAVVASIYFELRMLKDGVTAEGLAAIFD